MEEIVIVNPAPECDAVQVLNVHDKGGSGLLLHSKTQNEPAKVAVHRASVNCSKEIILASGSPRRKELLAQIGIAFQVIKSNAEEKITNTIPEEIVKDLSCQKASDVAAGIEEGIILGADTIVCLDHEIMGKPKDRADAYQMLERLQDRSHSVFTGVTLIKKANGQETKVRSFAVETKVKVHEMCREEIEAYLDTGDPFDKAGSYGIQGPFAAYVDGIEGDYNNVVGLPIAAVYQELKKL